MHDPELLLLVEPTSGYQEEFLIMGFLAIALYAIGIVWF